MKEKKLMKVTGYKNKQNAWRTGTVWNMRKMEINSREKKETCHLLHDNCSK